MMVWTLRWIRLNGDNTSIRERIGTLLHCKNLSREKELSFATICISVDGIDMGKRFDADVPKLESRIQKQKYTAAVRLILGKAPLHPRTTPRGHYLAKPFTPSFIESRIHMLPRWQLSDSEKAVALATLAFAMPVFADGSFLSCENG